MLWLLFGWLVWGLFEKETVLFTFCAVLCNPNHLSYLCAPASLAALSSSGSLRCLLACLSFKLQEWEPAQRRTALPNDGGWTWQRWVETREGTEADRLQTVADKEAEEREWGGGRQTRVSVPPPLRPYNLSSFLPTSLSSAPSFLQVAPLGVMVASF